MRRLRNIRWKRLVLLGAVGSVVGVGALVGVGYAVTDVPPPSASATATATRILYADGSELGRVGTENRIPVRLGEVPEPVQLAVLAAEDRGFYREPGISPKGIARALLTNVRGGGGVQQGGSTITQQYAKNAFLTSERTYTRKVKEVFIALKMTRTVDKAQILENYLNTIYFGRQASGLEVASRSYFGRPASDLTVSQGAVLAAVIRSPARLDPAKHPQDARARWGYVLDGMVEQGWLTPQERAAQVFPKVLAVGAGPQNNDLSGPKGHVISAVLDELGRNGFPEDRLSAGGLTVQTTIRKGPQDAAVAAVQEVTGAEPGKAELQGALVSVQPGTGEVVAYYGGATGTGFDYAGQGRGRQPGSSFKPYVLAAALESGVSLRSRLDGDSDRDFPGLAEPIENFGGDSFGRVDLVEATRRSINTAYYELGLEVGPAKVAELAHRAGIPAAVPLAGKDGVTNGSISLGGYEVHVIDQAVGFATFANKGVPVRPFMVKRVSQRDEVLYSAEVKAGPAAFSEGVAADATFAMRQVIQRGTGRSARLEGGREAAGKTGTSSDNRDAWFVGYTPELSTAVWLGYGDPRTIRIDGVEVTGGGFSTLIWKAFTDAALAGQPQTELPDRADVGERVRFGEPVEDPGSSGSSGSSDGAGRSGSSDGDSADRPEVTAPTRRPRPQRSPEPVAEPRTQPEPSAPAPPRRATPRSQPRPQPAGPDPGSSPAPGPDPVPPAGGPSPGG